MDVSEKIGKKRWIIAGSNIPLEQTGPEPAFSSHDSLWILNANGSDADVKVTIYYSDREPVGPYCLTVKARRVRQIRFNDLIDPEAIPLETDYGALVEAEVPVVVQFAQMDTRRAENSRTSMMGFPAG